MEPLLVQVDALAPSVNHLYVTVRRRRKDGRKVPSKHLTAAAEAWYGLAVPVVRAAASHAGWILPDGPLALAVHLYGLAGNRDIDNVLKGTIDAVAQALGFNDARITRLLVVRAGPRPYRTVIALSAERTPTHGRDAHP